VSAQPGVDPQRPHRCPICNGECARDADHRERGYYDDDCDYYWGSVRVPRWLALILEVPWRQQFDILLFGFVIGLIVAALALVWGLLLAQT
jgi:hypothetical protein